VYSEARSARQHDPAKLPDPPVFARDRRTPLIMRGNRDIYIATR
jgi:hypothetical protein